MNHLQKSYTSLSMMTMLTWLFFLPLSSHAQEPSLVSQEVSPGAFPLMDCSIIYDEADFAVVKKTAHLFAQDIEAVTGNRPRVLTQKTRGRVILLGTLGSLLHFPVQNHL